MSTRLLHQLLIAMFANVMKHTDQTPTILVVDDDEDARLLLLRWSLHEVMPKLIVRCVGDGEEALIYIRDWWYAETWPAVATAKWAYN